MTIINNQEDFLRALSENPEWRDAVRAQILGDELLNLPAHLKAFIEQMASFVNRVDSFIASQEQFNAEQRQFNAEQRQINAEQKQFNAEQRQINAEQRQFNAEQKQFNAEQKQFNAEQKQFNAEQRQINAEQKQFNAEQRQFNAEQRQINARVERRLDRMSNDIGQIKGFYARSAVIEDAKGIANDMGFTYTRTLHKDDLLEMANRNADSAMTVNERRSFREADLVIEAADDSGIIYIAMEISYTADLRDSDRAQRNAGILTDFTGRPSRAAIASVRNDRAVDELIDSGAVYWHILTDKHPNPE